jgi:hypothetical protein
MKLRYMVVVAISVLVAAPAALAASVQSGYEGGAGVQNQVGQSAGAEGVLGGSLPFTGLDLTLLVLGGLVLLTIGLVLRRAAVKRGV